MSSLDMNMPNHVFSLRIYWQDFIDILFFYARTSFP